MRFWWSLKCLPGGLRRIAAAILSLDYSTLSDAGRVATFLGDDCSSGWRAGDCGAFGRGPPAAGLRHAVPLLKKRRESGSRTAKMRRTVSCVCQALAILRGVAAWGTGPSVLRVNRNACA